VPLGGEKRSEGSLNEREGAVVVQFSHLRWALTTFNHENRRQYRGNEDVLNIKVRSGNAFRGMLCCGLRQRTLPIVIDLIFARGGGSTDRLQYPRGGT